jgi:hypothetical protein
MDCDEDPLDLLEDDGDGVIETCLFFDEDGKDKQSGNKPPGKSGCCVVLLGVGISLLMAGWGIVKWIA